MRTLRPTSARPLGEHLHFWGERSELAARLQTEYCAQLGRWGLDADAFGLRVVCHERCASGHSFTLHMRGGIVVTPANITSPAEPLEQPIPSGKASRQVAQAFGRVVVIVHRLQILPATVTRRLDSMSEVESAHRQRVTIEMPDGEEVMP